jgi:amino acid adenylation domain-containing protein
VISYGELADRIDRTQSRYRAARSTSRGTPDLVGVLVSHTPEMVEHLLGILYAGAAYCPIDAAVPAARKETLAAVLGLDRVFDATGGAYGPTSLHVDALPEATDDSQIPNAENDPAYVLCTSGSTGAPKPVVISRRALTATVRALRELFALTHEDRVLQFASLGWDTCLEEILPALTAGASLVFDEQAQSGSFPRFVRMLTERSITVLDLPTAFWHELVLFLHEGQVALPDSVRLVIIGGERIDPTRLQQWRELGTAHVGLLNTYGCTETTMITHAVHLAGPDGDPAVAADAVEVPLGRPLPHVTDHVTDEGELLVAGPGLATEYLGLPDRTAAGFPIEDHGGGLTRWFRTGDLVTRGERGLLYPRGRADEQVKVLGVRVHPAEVEMQLSTHPAVAAAVVVGERRLGQMSLRAFVVASSETTAADLKRHLRERLPSQFVPGRITFVAALAHTASGKVDRAATQRAAMDSDTKGEAS